MGSIEIFGWSPSEFFTAERIASIIRFSLLLIVGLPSIYSLSRWTRNYLTKRYSAQPAFILSKIVLYTGLLIIAFSLLNEMGFQITHLLTAASIGGIALGFASQTSISNIISGFFVMAEQPFTVDDVIKINDLTGQVLSIDTLSVKLRTFDNKMVRIPNENIIKSEVTNLTYFPIRRADILIGVAYKEDIARVKNILLELAHANPLCLQEPEPAIIFKGYGASSIDLQFSIWAKKSEFLKLKNSIQEEIKSRFDTEGIEIPFPHVSLYSGSATEPLPIKILGGVQPN